MGQQPLDLPVSSRWRGIIDYWRAVLVVGLPITRYPFCVLVSAIGWCGALSNILPYVWFLGRLWQNDRPLPTASFDRLLPVFLCAAVAVIAWHFRKKS